MPIYCKLKVNVRDFRHFADMCGEKLSLVSIGCQVEGLACADPGARTPIGASGICIFFSHSESEMPKTDNILLFLLRLRDFY